MPQKKGDSDDELEEQAQKIEFRDPQTNEVMFRASLQEAQKQLRKISQIIQTESFRKEKTNGSMEQGNTEDSEVLDSERQMLAG